MRFAIKLKTPGTRHISAPAHVLDPGQAADLSASYTPIMAAPFSYMALNGKQTLEKLTE
jgi:hypothetical protein